MITVGGMLTLFAGKEIVQTLVTYKAMAADQRALAAIEIKLADVPEGQVSSYILFFEFRTQKYI